MNYVACCADLEKLVIEPGTKRKGLGLGMVIHKWGTIFLLLYQSDLEDPSAGSGRRLCFVRFAAAGWRMGLGRGKSRDQALSSLHFASRRPRREVEGSRHHSNRSTQHSAHQPVIPNGVRVVRNPSCLPPRPLRSDLCVLCVKSFSFSATSPN
jgi:hypothetical protein